MRNTLFFTGYLFLMPMFLAAQGARILHGTVVTATDNQPLATAAVFERSTGNFTFTDENGWFEILLEGESPRISVEFLGLQPVEIAVGGNAENLTIELERTPAQPKRRDRKKYAFNY